MHQSNNHIAQSAPERDKNWSPIGVFDSGYGGLTILREMQKLLPQYDYLYLGDNARAPYGTRSFDIVYRFRPWRSCFVADANS